MKEWLKIFGMLFIALLPLTITLTSIWLIGSGVVSAVKSFNKDCGKEYNVEVVFSGNFFCPKE